MTKSRIITAIPVFNGEGFIGQTLQSIAEQTVRPDRLVVVDNCSTDNTERIVKEFKPIACEWRRNEKNIGLWPSLNRILELAQEAEYLHMICADDVIVPEYYATLTRELADCKSFGLAYCLDERIDENNQRLSLSGRVTGQIEVQNKADFLREKAEISNHAFSGSLLKTNCQKAPCQFRLDLPILADVMFWAEYGKHCEKIVRLHQPLVKYRWHDNGTANLAPQIQPLVLDEWRVMQEIERLRGAEASPVRTFKLKGLFSVRSGIKAKRFREQKNVAYSRQIVRAAKEISGPLAWYMGQALVHTRDVAVYKLGGRKKHPKNVYG
jgi:glycosyltransferase involved in cell wall biosynthesis